MNKSQKRKVKNAAKKYPKVVAAIAVILAVIIIASIVLWFVKPELYHKFLGVGDHNFDDNGVCIVCGYERTGSGEEKEIISAELSIHFLELGNKSAGDSVLIKCGDTEVLIDAGSEQSSAKTIKEYVDKYCKDGKLEYVISTHADSDHISAFVGTAQASIFKDYEIETFIKFDKSDKNLNTSAGNKTLYAEYLDGVEYIRNKGTNVYTASECYDEKNGAKRQFFLDEKHTVSINILYNYFYYYTSSDENNYSVVTLLTQELESGDKHYLFTGDLEKEGENKLVEYYSAVPAEYRTEYNILPQVELYKAGHHGSRTSSSMALLNVIKPKNIAVCCCCGAPEYTKINDNTFPTQEMIDNVGKFTDKIYVTTIGTGLPEKDKDGNYVSRSYEGYASMNGNIVFYTTGGKLKLYCSNNDTILKDTEWFKGNRKWSGISTQ